MTDDVIGQYTKRLREAFAPVITRGQKVALAGFTESPDCGNHAVWLGEKRLLAELGAELVYECSPQSYNRAAMAEKLGGGAVLLHGGSYSGPRSAAARVLRWNMLQEFPDNPVVGLPFQPVAEESELLKKAAETASSRKNVTLFASSGQAQKSLQTVFGASARIELAPDTTFLLGRQKHPAGAEYDIVWIARTDGDRANDQTEIAARISSQPAEKFVIAGFTDGIEMSFVAKQRPPTILLTDWQALVYENELARLAVKRLSFDAWSDVFFHRALHILSLGHVVITDRLHAHLFCLLLRIPHVLLNDGAGRNWQFHESWTKSSPLCRLARNPAEAWSLARNAAAFLKEGKGTAENWSWQNPALSADDN